MSNIKINDVFQRIQYAATLNQTQFAIPFPFFANAYVYVWQDGVQIIQGGGAGQYGITGAGSPSGGQITLVTPATAGSIITIEGIMPIDRTSIYSATISNLTGSDLNGDFNREVVMMKQIETTQALLQLQYAPWAVISQDITVTKDRYIPLLPALGAWRMNAGATAIETFQTPSSGGIAPDDATYILQVANSELPNAQAMGALASGLVVNTLTTGVQLTRLLAATANQLAITNASGIAGNPTYGFAANARFPGTEGIGLVFGTTAERPGTPTGTNLRFNTDLLSLEYWDGTNWNQLAETDAVSIQGTENQVLANGTFGVPVDGAVILTLPQDIATTSSPTFNNLVLTGGLIRGDNNTIALTLVDNVAAVNNVLISNTITGLSPSVAASGTDTNIALTLASQASGNITLLTQAPTQPLYVYSGTSAQHLSIFQFSNTAATRTLIFPDANGTVALLDSNNNLSANNFLGGFATTVSAGGSSSLTVASAYNQEVTGTLTHTFSMPVPTTLTTGHPFKIINNSSGVVTINSSGGNLILTMAANTTAFLTCVLASGTTAASWNASYVFDNGAGVLSITGTANQVIASASTGAVVLSLPQDIGTSSAVRFASARLSNLGILDNNGVTILALNATASADAWMTLGNQIASGGAPSLTATGASANIALVLDSKGTEGANCRGKSSGVGQSVGYVGEQVSSEVLSASATNINSATSTNLTSISVTAGNWLITGNISFLGSLANITQANVWISTASASIPDFALRSGMTTAAIGVLSLVARQLTIRVTSTTTVYLTGNVTLASGTATQCGTITATRI